MHFVDEGDGDAVLLLHGNPTWGFLYRDVIGPLVQSGRRVVVPDMIGFRADRRQAATTDQWDVDESAFNIQRRET